MEHLIWYKKTITYWALLLSFIFILSAQSSEAKSYISVNENLLIGEKEFLSGNFEKARAAFEKVLDQNSRSAQAHYFLGLIEYEKGNTEKAKIRFQIAHECISLLPTLSGLAVDSEQAQIEFPQDYEARVYYNDGWYVFPKGLPAESKTVHSLKTGSKYRIELQPRRRGAWIYKGVIGFTMVLSFLLAR